VTGDRDQRFGVNTCGAELFSVPERFLFRSLAAYASALACELYWKVSRDGFSGYQLVKLAGP